MSEAVQERESSGEGEYALRGDYHRHLDPHWSYAPIYRRKLEWLDARMKDVPSDARVLDVGSGEGAIVDRYRERGHEAVGVDAFYSSEYIQKADLRQLPFEDGRFDVALCLDVLEHVELLEQPKALAEIARVTKPGARLFVTVPNLAHLHSRIRFLLTGKLTRTSRIDRHPGDRPIAELSELVEQAGFRIVRRGGIFPTVPFLFRAVNRHPDRFGWLVPLLDAVVPFSALRFLSTIEAVRKE